MHAYDRGGGLQPPPQFRLPVFFGQQGKFGQSVLLLLLCVLLLLLCFFFLKRDSSCLAHDEFLFIFNFKRDSLMYMYVFGIVPLLLGTALHYTT